MKYLLLLFILGAGACTSIKLSVPSAFKDQATEFHVKGAHNNKMAYAGYHTSRIKRGLHVIYPGWSGVNILENILLNEIGINKEVNVVKEKARFRYKLFEDGAQLEVYGAEKSTKRTTEFSLIHVAGPFNSYERPEEYKYIFSSVIKTDLASVTDKWDLVMSNAWERQKDPVKSIFTIIPRDDYGFATNTVDSIFINPVSIRDAEGRHGQKGRLPFRMLAGYELSTADGVITIIDLIGHNVWVYNELTRKERLVVAGITTALFARKVNNTQW
jgi:hypothetical protein